MQQHRWIVAGTARISTAQAREWAEGTDEVTHEPLAVQLDQVICASCLQESSEEVGPACPGPDDEGSLGHAWQMSLTTPISDDADEPFDPGIPHAVSVACLLCGALPDDADHDCPERALWAGPAIGVPDDVSSLDGESDPDPT